MTDAQIQEYQKPNPYNVASPQNYNQWNAPSPAYLAPNPLNSNPGQVPPPAYYATNVTYSLNRISPVHTPPALIKSTFK